MLADTLCQMGISSFRYDKRGIGESTKVGEEQCTLYDRVDDVNAVSNYFADNFDQIILYGHSEGALVATIAGTEEHIDGCILASDTSVTLDKIILEQTAQYTRLTPMLEKYFDEIRGGDTLSEIHVVARSIMRPSSFKQVLACTLWS